MNNIHNFTIVGKAKKSIADGFSEPWGISTVSPVHRNKRFHTSKSARPVVLFEAGMLHIKPDD